jgi:mannose/fructose/N-acetylgalactosamine-specific phosphotransferase system component IIC
METFDIINDIVLAVTPFIVLLATSAVTYIRRRIPDWVVVTLIVPVVSMGYAVLSELLLNPAIVWYYQFLYGLVAVFIYQVVQKLQNRTELME